MKSQITPTMETLFLQVICELFISQTLSFSSFVMAENFCDQQLFSNYFYANKFVNQLQVITKAHLSQCTNYQLLHSNPPRYSQNTPNYKLWKIYVHMN